MSLVKQLAPRWKLNAVISQANTLLSVLLPVKNGSDKTPAVSIALEIWIALNYGKQTVLLPCFLQIASKMIQRGLMELDRLLAWFLFCIAGAPVRASHPCNTSGMHWRGKKSLDPWSRRVSCTRWVWRLPRFTAKQGIFTKPLCLSGCQWTWGSTVGQQVWGEKGGVKPPWSWRWTWLTVSDPFSALFSPSESFQLPSLVLRHHFSQDFFSTLLVLVIAWTLSTLKPQERAGAQSHHS